jgi:DNA-binding NarL/FixJ family response regulator
LEATVLTSLTERERQIVHLIAKGLSNKEVGRQLDVSEGTIKIQVHQIYLKLVIHNRLALAARAVRDAELCRSSCATDVTSQVASDNLPDQRLRLSAVVATALRPATTGGLLEATTQISLTDRERQIVRLIAKGLSNKQIGRELDVCEGTIKVHLHHIFQKLVIYNRAELAALAVREFE